MARQVKNNTEIYKYKNTKFLGTEDMNLARWIPAKYLDFVLLVYVLVIGAIPWTILWLLNIHFLSLVPVSSLMWAAPAMYAYKKYQKDRYASVPTTLLGRLLWSHYTRLADIWVDGKPYYGETRIVQVKFLHPLKEHDSNTLTNEDGEDA